MAGVNKVILVGNLGKDPEIRAFENGRKVASFSLATTEVYKDRNGERVEKTEWHNVNFWGPLADVIEKYVRKGSKLYVEGKLRTRSYEQDGVKKYTTDIEGQTMTMLDSARNGESNGAGNSFSGGSSARPAGSAAPTPAPFADDSEENDLPF
jgi:single-strand DNA-binding protein